MFRKQDTSVSQAKRAISDYKKAVGDPEGLAELMVFYCERAAGFSSDIANDDEGYFDALMRMFEQALKLANALSADRRDDLITRLDRVRVISHDFGYGVGDDMDFLLSKSVLRLMVRESWLAFDGRTTRVAQTCRKHTVSCARVRVTGVERARRKESNDNRFRCHSNASG